MGSFKDLPTDIILDILSRLPTESILDCKLVCRPWRDLVSHHPSFSQLHLTHLNHSDDSGKLSFFCCAVNQKHLYYFEYNDDNNNETPIDCTRRINLTLPFNTFKVLGSVNGLVCLYGWLGVEGFPFSYCVCNPLTREYVTFPKMKEDLEYGPYLLCASGFGYLPITNEYKVVGFYKLSRQLDFIEVAVYTLGSGNGWRNVGRLDSKYCKLFLEDGVFVNGALHWLDKGGETYFVFDLAQEKFREHVSQPPSPPGNTWYGIDNTLGVLGGVLYFTITYDRQISKLWILQERNDIRDVKEHQVEHEPLGWNEEATIPFNRKPFAFTKSGAILCFNRSFLGIYDPTTATSKKLVNRMTFNEIIPHKNTFVSLKELGEEDVKILESAEILERGSRDSTTKKLAR